MDLSKFKKSDWLKVGGAAAVLIGYFLDWTSLDCAGFAACEDSNLSGSSFFFRGTLPWLLIVAVGVITFLLAASVMKSGTLPWPLIFLAASAVATLLILIYIISPSYGGISGIGRGIGAWLALVGAGVTTAGAVIGFKESGGDLNDLKDIKKIKSQFGNSGGSGMGDGTPPPPPPPGMSPPPPPPPMS